MIEEDSKVDPRSLAGDERFDEAMLYDYAKFLVTLAVLALGALLTLSQALKEVKPFVLLPPAVFICASGICSFSAASKLAKAGPPSRTRMTASDMLRWGAFLLSAGLGGLMFVWWLSL